MYGDLAEFRRQIERKVEVSRFYRADYQGFRNLLRVPKGPLFEFQGIQVWGQLHRTRQIIMGKEL